MLQRYKLTPASPIMTPLMSDTFFGHFCWAIRYRSGEDYLAGLLGSFGEGKLAPVLFSSAFPTGHLPRPAFPPLGRARIAEFVHRHFGQSKKDEFEGFTRVKGLNKRRLLTLEQWHRLRGGYAEEKVLEELLRDETAGRDDIGEDEVSTANMINRISGTVSEGGGVFPREKRWYHAGTQLDLYVSVNLPELYDLVRWFLIEFLPENGFGADKSVGMGRFQTAMDDSFSAEEFGVPDANARLSLSLCSFPDMGSYKVFYRLKTKFGKLGGSFAAFSPTGGNPRPFKKPILMYEPGAVFLRSGSLEDRPLLEGIHSDARIRHCGVPITVPLRLLEDMNYAFEATQAS